MFLDKKILLKLPKNGEASTIELWVSDDSTHIGHHNAGTTDCSYKQKNDEKKGIKNIKNSV